MKKWYFLKHQVRPDLRYSFLPFPQNSVSVKLITVLYYGKSLHTSHHSLYTHSSPHLSLSESKRRFSLSQILQVFPNFQISALSKVNWYQAIITRRSLRLAVWCWLGNNPDILAVPSASALRGISHGQEEDLRCFWFNMDDSFPAESKEIKQRIAI
jgi:hypothetical protein